MTRAFTEPCLAAIHMMKLAGCDLDRMAYALSRSRQEIDQASWALVGRSIPAAVASINRPRIVEAST